MLVLRPVEKQETLRTRHVGEDEPALSALAFAADAESLRTHQRPKISFLTKSAKVAT